MDIQWLMEVLNDLVIRYGYLGAFILAIVSNMILFMPVPYLITFFLIGESPETNIIVLSIAGGIGAALGKMLSYAVGLGGSKIIGEERRKRMMALRKLLKKYGALIILIVAATPMPDDIFLIPFGMMQYDIIKYFIACATGKAILTLTVTVLGRVHYIIVTKSNVEIGILVSVIGFIIISAIIFGIDWEHILKVIESEGLKSGLKDFMVQLINLLSYNRLRGWVKRIGKRK